MIRLRNENTAKYIAKNSTKRKYYGLEHWSMYNLCAFFRIFYHSYTVISHSRKCAYKKITVYRIPSGFGFCVLAERKKRKEWICWYQYFVIYLSNTITLYYCMFVWRKKIFVRNSTKYYFTYIFKNTNFVNTLSCWTFIEIVIENKGFFTRTQKK